MRRVPSGIAVLSLAGLLALLACGGGSSSAPVAALPGDASFGEVDVGGSAARRVELTNTSAKPLTLVAVRSDSGLVTSGEALPLTIAPGETASLSVELAPTTEGEISATVEFLAEDETNPLAVFQATGKGVRPNKLDSSMAAVDFATVPIGGSLSEEVTLTNGGTTSVRIASLTVSAAGVVATGLPLPATFAPGESATFTLTYAPTVEGPTSGAVVVRAEHGRPATVVQVSGTGLAPSTGPAPAPAPAPATLAAAPTRVDFGQVTVGGFSAQGVTLTNNGSGSITVSEVATTGSGFATSGLTAGTTIAPGTSQTLTTRFTPAAQGAASGQVTLRTAGQTEPLAVVDLAGSGVAAASITSVTVRDTTVEASKTVQVQADVVAVGTIDKSVRWSVDPASIGTIDPVTGVYSAPAAPGIYRVWATSNADATKRGVATVTVTATPAVPVPPPTSDSPASGTLLGTGWTGSTSLTEFPKTGDVTTCVGGGTGCIVDIDDGAGGKTPYQRLLDALDLLSSYSRVLVRNNSGATVVPTAQITRTAAWGSTKQFFAYGSQRIKLSGSSCSGCTALRWSDAQNEHWKGFEVTGYRPAYDGNVFVQTSTAIKLEDFWVHDNPAPNGTVGVLGGSSHVLQDMLIWHNGDTAVGGTNNGDCIGVSYSGAATNIAIVRAYCANTGDDGIDLWAGTNSRVIDSVVREAGKWWTGNLTGGDGNGIKLGGRQDVPGSNSVIGSIVINGTAWGLDENMARGSTAIKQVTVHGNGVGGIGLGAGPLGTNSIQGLISHGQSQARGNVNAGQDYSTATDPNNCWSAQFQSTETTACRDPMFADPARGDFSLLPGSPYSGTGQNGATLGASTVALQLLKDNWARR
jgi:hypothetical protein